MFKAKRPFQSVVDELVQGLKDGSIRLSESPSAQPRQSTAAMREAEEANGIPQPTQQKSAASSDHLRPRLSPRQADTRFPRRFMSSSIIHARLDQKTAALCRRLNARLGWSGARIVREGIKALAILLKRKVCCKDIGQGRFRSRVPDLGSNEKHVEGFGQ